MDIFSALIVSLPPTLVGLAALITAIKSVNEIRNLHIQINSRMDQLLRVTGAESKAQGKAEGIESERLRNG